MNKEFRLSILEMIILLICSDGNKWGYEISQEVFDILTIKEGISYPMLNKLTNEGLLVSKIEEINNLGQKKFYRITEDGIIKLRKFTSYYQNITQKINNLLKGIDFYE